VVLVSLLAAIGTLVLVAALVAMPSAAPSRSPLAQTQEAPPVSPLGARNDSLNPYLPGVSWGQLPDGRKWGSTAGIYVNRDGNIWAIDRCGARGSRGTNCADSPLDPILEFDPSGKFLKSFGKGLFVSPHKITVDRNGNLWIADNGLKDGKGQQVFKFDQNGKILMTLGRAGVAGPGLDTFDQPTEVAIAPNGDIFVADGHGEEPSDNARIMKFDAHGKFLKTWGKKGTGIGEFDCPHTLAFDSKGRLFVGDRQNNRIQVFDQDGHFIAEWKQFGRPSGIYIDKNDVIYVADSESRNGEPGYGYNPGCRRGIRIGGAKDGSVKYFVPDAAPFPATEGSTGPEGITADGGGNMYGAEFTMDVKKYVLK
ncbi:MAG TPA: peptidyl-alpha-hydroxyglycine alpha-amidating lyase family protein, partial [Candidatus Dormibacteraeota bacterium]|nr:peptidyl-alpha-hydroxyglycine alpha-amidating lyase family protein [Candidatus Dormibacteraeota bacterium]